jgi:hypothetical protein
MKTTPHTFTITPLEGISSPCVNITISEESTLPECIEAFENFLHAVGYRFPTGATLGYEWDGEDNATTPEYENDCYDRMVEIKLKQASLIAAVNFCLAEYPSDRASVYLAPIMEKLFQK